MDHLSISESILRSLEAREKRRGGAKERRAEPPAAPRGPSAEDVLLAACARELERTVRDSVRTSFAHWEAGLIREVEGIARRVSRSRESIAPEPVDSPRPPAAPPAAAPPAATAASRGDGPAPAVQVISPRGAPRKAGSPPGDESWDDRVAAVKELRREWDQETFEKCFGDDSVAESAPQAARPAPPAVAPRRESEPPPREALGKKLDELIHLVKSSQPRETKPPPAAREVSSDIAREVVGRLKDTLSTMARSPAPGADKAPPPEARIPPDDISAMIDQITGSARP